LCHVGLQEVAQLVAEGIPEEVKAHVGRLVMDNRYTPSDVARLRQAASLQHQEQHKNLDNQMQHKTASSVQQVHSAAASSRERPYTTLSSSAAATGAPCAQQWGLPCRLPGLLTFIRPSSQQLAPGSISGFTKRACGTSILVSKIFSSQALPLAELETGFSGVADGSLDINGMSHHNRGSVDVVRGAHAFASLSNAFDFILQGHVDHLVFINGMLSRPVLRQLSKALRQLC
jgi:hypothetical protein